MFRGADTRRNAGVSPAGPQASRACVRVGRRGRRPASRRDGGVPKRLAEHSLATAQFLEDSLKRDRLAALALRNRLEQHFFSFLIRLEGLIPFRKQDGNGGALRKLGVHQLYVSIDHAARGDSHGFMIIDGR